MNLRTADHCEFRWIGRGIYTAAEASRLTKVSSGRIRRWIQGYAFDRRGKPRSSPPVISPEIDVQSENFVALTFKDLIEVMCVNGFLKAGVKWPRLRKAHERSAELLGLEHPFATRQFLTDGHSVLLRLGNEGLLDIVSNQYALFRILAPFLKTDGLDFVGAFAARWWPMGKRIPVVLDAARSFGQPIVEQGIPTSTLYRAYLSERPSHARSPGERDRFDLRIGSPDGRPEESTVRYVADWYSIPPRSVRAAIDYESRLAA